MNATNAIGAIASESSHLAEKVVRTFENLNPRHLQSLREIYARDICFEDPVRGIQGLDALIHYFETLFDDVEHLRIRFHRSVISEDGLFFSWTMTLEHKAFNRGKTIRVEGASYLKFRDGRIYYHRDYFDVGALVYENLPVLGGIVRLIRTRMAG